MFQNVQPFSAGMLPGNPTEARQLVPRVDVVEAQEEIIYIFEVPGIEINSVNVEIGNGTLQVDGQLETGLPQGNLNYLYQERSPSKKYGRLLSIPPEVDHENVKANVKNGLLMVHFPKKNTGKRLPVNPQEQQELQQGQVKKQRKKYTVNDPKH
ncbi:MAG: Hsp20/alpha crystallin family protein [Dethiobacter sp.]|jgi:HSP20 family protein|nr:Hsp20/alpha crystallin family protein [Dethiobacter sp.]